MSKLKYMKLWESFANDENYSDDESFIPNDISHQLDPMLNSYLYTALWTEELEGEYDVNDFSADSKEKAKTDCNLFKEKAGDLLNGLDLDGVGHDFWLTRNGHGAGFWDGDYEESIGQALTEISKEFGEINVEVGDDNNVELF